MPVTIKSSSRKLDKQESDIVAMLEKRFNDGGWRPGFSMPHPFAADLKSDGDGIMALYDPHWITKDTDESERLAHNIITRREKDRVGDVVEPRGIDMSSYKKNPVVFFNHLPMLLVGTSINQKKMSDHVIATTKFHELTREAVDVGNMVLGKILKGVSIGFIPTKITELPKEFAAGEDEIAGGHIRKSELLEYSHVSIPAVRGALTTAVERHTAKSAVIHYLLQKSLEAGADEQTPIWSPGISLPEIKKEIPSAHEVSLDIQTVHAKCLTDEPQAPEYDFEPGTHADISSDDLAKKFIDGDTVLEGRYKLSDGHWIVDFSDNGNLKFDRVKNTITVRMSATVLSSMLKSNELYRIVSDELPCDAELKSFETVDDDVMILSFETTDDACLSELEPTIESVSKAILADDDDENSVSKDIQHSEKAGRVLSNKNLTKLQQASNLLVDVIESSGMSEDDDNKSAEIQKSPACRQDGESREECISRKIPEIKDENPNMDNDQAVAIAASLCDKPCSDKSAEFNDRLRTAMKNRSNDKKSSFDSVAPAMLDRLKNLTDRIEKLQSDLDHARGKI